MSFITESTWYLKRVAKNFNYRLTGHYQKNFHRVGQNGRSVFMRGQIL